MRVIMNKLQTERFENIKIGTPFYRYNRDYGHNVLYMKTTESFSSSEEYLVQKRYNIVNVENGELDSISNDALVVIANVHVECDSKI